MQAIFAAMEFLPALTSNLKFSRAEVMCTFSVPAALLN
jgi:hypothetical protein